jgi:hypothetical protein
MLGRKVEGRHSEDSTAEIRKGWKSRMQMFIKLERQKGRKADRQKNRNDRKAERQKIKKAEMHIGINAERAERP